MTRTCLCFNSLQTGRTSSTDEVSREYSELSVSIPFKRDGLSQPQLKHRRIRRSRRFNSLQTGRAFQTELHIDKGAMYTEFQFPSNGKDFPNGYWSHYEGVGQPSVSIPFKREGLSEQTYDEFGVDPILMFQFPANGMGFLNEHYLCYHTDKRYKVSIPFKRERLSEQKFRSNGGQLRETVSIPFKRDGFSEQTIKAINDPEIRQLFQFPSNGNGFHNSEGDVIINLFTFQFPSNGNYSLNEP